MKPIDYYTSAGEYSSRVSKPMLPSKHTSDEAAAYVIKLKEYEEVLQPEYKAKKDAYDAKSRDLLDEFKKDLFEEYGVTNNPKKDLLWSKAWDHGHSSGLGNVEYHFRDLVDLIL